MNDSNQYIKMCGMPVEIQALWKSDYAALPEDPLELFTAWIRSEMIEPDDPNTDVLKWKHGYYDTLYEYFLRDNRASKN